MTVAEVYAAARKMSAGTRLAAWTICCGGTEKHPKSMLEPTSPPGNYFCEGCWTLFDQKQKPLNEPKMLPPDSHQDD